MHEHKRGTAWRWTLAAAGALALAGCGLGGAHEDRVRDTDHSTYRSDTPTAVQNSIAPAPEEIGRTRGIGGSGVLGQDSTLPPSSQQQTPGGQPSHTGR